MGGANTKEVDEEPPPVSGVQVTAGLVRQLEGESASEPQARTVRRAGPAWLPHLRPAGLPQAANEPSSTAATQESDLQLPGAHVAQQLAQDGSLAQAVQHEREQMQQQASPRQIRAESASQQQVNDYADQLVKEYEVPLKALPCSDEKTECLLCYHSNQQDPLRCASQVDAFTRCARNASSIMVK